MDFKEQLKSAIDIWTVVGEYVRLKKSGTQRYMGLCPFHNEKTPSFTVHAVHQFYKCFSCGAGGDVLDFVMRIEGVSFYEALKLLAERHGIPMPKRSVVADEESRVREAIFRMHELAVEHFRANLQGSAGEMARGYLARRGVAPETVAHFGIGYSLGSGRAMLRILEQQGFSAAQLERSGLVRKRDDGSFYDYFRNRLMFPIHSEFGKPIGFGGRALAEDDSPKYLNSPETPIYKKSHVLYNLHRAKEAIGKEDRSVLVEGYMDAVGVTAAGFRAVVASCGTSLTTQQIQALKRHSQKIVVNFDPDAPGANAAERSITLLLDEGMEVRIMELDGDLDPDEYCKERGADAYRERLAGAKGYFFWLADRARAKNDMHTPEGKVAVLRSLVPALNRIADRLERMAVANEVAGYIGVDRGLVLDSVLKAVADRKETVRETAQSGLRHDERVLLGALLGEPSMRTEVIGQLKSIQSIDRLPSNRIFQVAFALDASGGQLTFDEIHARLEENDRRLLADALMREDIQASPEEVLAAIESMKRSEHQDLRLRLKTRIKEAERAGAASEALRLMAELQQLERGAR